MGRVKIRYTPKSNEYDLILLYNEDEMPDEIVKEVFVNNVNFLNDKKVIYNIGDDINDIIEKVKTVFEKRKKKEEKVEEMNKILETELPPEITHLFLR